MAKRRSREQIDADKIIKRILKRVRRKGVPASNGNKERYEGCKMNRITKYNPIPF
jgi:hypothetical protein